MFCDVWSSRLVLQGDNKKLPTAIQDISLITALKLTLNYIVYILLRLEC